MNSNEAMSALCEALAAEAVAGPEFELELGTLVGWYRKKHDRLMKDMRAAELLPLGPEVAAARLGVKRRTVYYMAERARKKVQASATRLHG